MPESMRVEKTKVVSFVCIGGKCFYEIIDGHHVQEMVAKTEVVAKRERSQMPPFVHFFDFFLFLDPSAPHSSPLSINSAISPLPTRATSLPKLALLFYQQRQTDTTTFTMSDDAMQGTLTYDQDIQDLPEDDNDTGNNSNDQPVPAGPLVTLLSLNTHAASIPLTRNKTILGRVAGTSHFLLFLF